MDIRYPAKIEKQEDGKYLVQFVDLPDTFTEGDTLEEALFNASEALTGMLGFHVDEGHDLPAPSENVEGAYYVVPDAKTQAVLLLKLARGDRKGVGNQLATSATVGKPAPLAKSANGG